jgi:oligosaccharide repeat unit polymerase
MTWTNKIKSFHYYIFILLPLALILSNAVANFIVFYISLIGFYETAKGRNHHFFTNNFIKIFILFCIFITLNSLILNSGFLSLKSSILFIRYLFFILGIWSMIKDNEVKFFNFFKFYIVILVFLFIDSNFQILNDGKNIIGYNSYLFQNNRISSFFNSELILGSYVEKFSIICICYLTIFKNKTSKKLIFFILFFTLEICLISGERRAFYSFLIFTFFYIFFIFNINNKIKIFLTIIIISMLSTLIFLNVNLKNRAIKDTGISISETGYTYFSSGHYQHFKNAIELFKEKPFSGHGSNSFRLNCERIDHKFNINGCSTHPHNIIAQFLAEKGLIGIIFLLTFYLSLLYAVALNLKKNNLNKKNILLLISIIIFFNPFFPSGNFYNSWVNNIVSIIFIFLLIKKKEIHV